MSHRKFVISATDSVEATATATARYPKAFLADDAWQEIAADDLDVELVDDGAGARDESGVFALSSRAATARMPAAPSPLAHLFRSLPPPVLVPPILDLGGPPPEPREPSVPARVATSLVHRATVPSSRAAKIAAACALVLCATALLVLFTR